MEKIQIEKILDSAERTSEKFTKKYSRRVKILTSFIIVNVLIGVLLQVLTGERSLIINILNIVFFFFLISVFRKESVGKGGLLLIQAIRLMMKIEKRRTEIDKMIKKMSNELSGKKHPNKSVKPRIRKDSFWNPENREELKELVSNSKYITDGCRKFSNKYKKNESSVYTYYYKYLK